MTIQVKTYVPGMAIEPGFYEMDAETYHSRDGGKWPLTLSSSIVKVLSAQSALHAYHCHPQLGGKGKDSTKSMDVGSIAHELILGKGGGFVELKFDSYRTKDAQEARDEVLSNGMTPVLTKELEPIKALVEGFGKTFLYSEAHDFFKSGTHSELAAFFYIEDVLCQILIDRVNLQTGQLWDVKTTTSANPEAIGKKVNDFGYDVASVFYRLGFETLVPELAGRSSMTFLFVESSAPYAGTAIQLSGMGEQVAEIRVNRALKLWKECVNTGKWPGYGDTILRPDPPIWVMKEELGDLI